MKSSFRFSVRDGIVDSTVVRIDHKWLVRHTKPQNNCARRPSSTTRQKMLEPISSRRKRADRKRGANPSPFRIDQPCDFVARAREVPIGSNANSLRSQIVTQKPKIIVAENTSLLYNSPLQMFHRPAAEGGLCFGKLKALNDQAGHSGVGKCYRLRWPGLTALRSPAIKSAHTR
jgi:hypothetical protein